MKAIFIMGAAAGIGRATARLFASRGWRVGLYDIDADAVNQLAGELGDNAHAGTVDVRDAEAVKQALAEFAEVSGGRLDVMFNNAGVVQIGKFDEIPAARHRAIVDINLGGVINGAQAAYRYLKATPGACLINMSSASAIYGTPSFASYSATKFAVKGLTEALDIEWVPDGIRVMDVLPLFVKTAMVDVEDEPASLRRLGVRLQPEDIARTVWRAAHRRWWRRVHWYVGAQTHLMAFAIKLSPARLNRATTRILSGY